MALDAAAQHVLTAVTTLHQPGIGTHSLSSANEWLEQFQHSAAAWQVSWDSVKWLIVLCAAPQSRPEMTT